MTQPIEQVIEFLNTRSAILPSVQLFMLVARVQRAAKLGNVAAQQYVTLCELNIEIATRH